MAQVTARQLTNRVDEVLDRVASGEHVIVTIDGRPIAELRPLTRSRVRAEDLLHRWSRLPHVDPKALREDIDRVAAGTL